MIVVDFFNHVNMLYGTISEFCTPEKVSCFVQSDVLLRRADTIVPYNERRSKVSYRYLCHLPVMSAEMNRYEFYWEDGEV
jgi:hypothetical protein